MESIERKIRAVLKPSELSEILTNTNDGLAGLNRAESQLAISEMAVAGEPAVSISLSYDAARKSVAAILEAFGLRVHERAGSHSSFVKVTSIDVFNQDIWCDLEWMKKLRNQSQYGDSTMPELTPRQAVEALLAARSMVADARRILALFVGN
jgi:hypothetical protein